MKVATYWFFFVFFAGAICLLPVWFIFVGRGQPKSLNILAVAYTLGQFEGLWRQITFALHIGAASILAIPFAVRTHFRSVEDKTETQFSIGYIMLVTAVVSVAFAISQSMQIDLAYVYPIIFPLLGSLICSFVVGRMERRSSFANEVKNENG